MMQAPSTPEIASFVARLLKRTRKNQIDWKERSHAVEAEIGNGYSVRLTEVSDFDGESDTPDHILILIKDGNELFSVDRRIVSGDDLSEHLGVRVPFSYTVFAELWNRALLKSRRITDHLTAVNSMLIDDDEVPL
jgi:hypothetical protein